MMKLNLLQVYIFIGGCACGTFVVVLYEELTSNPRVEMIVDDSIFRKLDTVLQHLGLTSTLYKYTVQQPSNDDQPLSMDLVNKVSVLVWVMTQPEDLTTKAEFIKQTWGSRVNKVLFVSDTYDQNIPTINVTVPNHITAKTTVYISKTIAVFDYVYEHYHNDYDWFMQTEDDTYVIVENLRYFLSDKNSQDPVSFGHFFPTHVNHSGGCGYVLSKEALKRFGQRQPDACTKFFGHKNVQMDRCLELHGVKSLETRDKEGKSRFHCFSFPSERRAHRPEWNHTYGNQKMGQVSDYPVTFHHLSVLDMQYLEFYTYHIQAYGK